VCPKELWNEVEAFQQIFIEHSDTKHCWEHDDEREGTLDL
jgi:hypothetical protein